ncbi:MAG: matrixin family metalloprotease [Chloroflexi bacterium]|nr:matrixin family metalloprotease [Chloroflexota bacterium]
MRLLLLALVASAALLGAITSRASSQTGTPEAGSGSGASQGVYHGGPGEGAPGEDLGGLAAEAERIVVGRVQGLTSYWTADASTIRTDVAVTPSRYLKGTVDSSGLVLTLPGGRVGHIQIAASGMPSFVLGEQVVLFLGRSPGGRPYLVGNSQGKFGVDAGGSVERVRVPLDRFENLVRQAVAGQLPQEGADVETGAAASPAPPSLHWAEGDIPVTYYVNPDDNRPANLTAEETLTAVTNGFQTWQDVPSASIGFAFGGTTARSALNNNDGYNDVIWAAPPGLDPNTLGVTYSTFILPSLTLLESDIQLNPGLASDIQLKPSLVWHTNGISHYDVETVVLHEAGHFLGLPHSSVQESVMYPSYQGVRRQLSQYDIDAVSAVYPMGGQTPTASATPAPTPSPTPTPAATPSPTPTPAPSPAYRAVLIDIKPNSYPNSINGGGKGTVAVAVLSEADFDASSLSANSVVFAGAAPARWAVEAVNGDGQPDMILYFPALATTLQADDVEACLTGQTGSGEDVQGCDSVRMVAPSADSDGDSQGLGLPRLTGDDPEASVGTDQMSSCSTADVDAWPPDLNRDGRVDLSDLDAFRGHIASVLGQTGYDERLDLSFDGEINVKDIGVLQPFLGQSCWESDPDSDGDGFRNQQEAFVGTDPLRACGANAWPPDFDDSGKVDIFDLSLLAPAFRSAAPGPPYRARFDLTADGDIDIFDINRLAPPVFMTSCGP